MKTQIENTGNFLNTKGNLNNKHFIAQKGVEKIKILYNFQNGGGIKGGCVKAGDVLKVISEVTSIDTVCVRTDKTLNHITKQTFMNPEFFICLD